MSIRDEYDGTQHSASDLAEMAWAKRARTDEIMAGNPEYEAATLAVRGVTRCGHEAIFPASEREFAGHCRSGNMPNSYAWGVCTCEAAARAALDTLTPAESRALARETAEMVEADDARRVRL